jgi:hypothetical protein
LTTGLVIKVKKARSKRLRELVRFRSTMAVRIQALWRRAVVRQCYKYYARDYWIQCQDEEQEDGEVYYFNTWTQVL